MSGSPQNINQTVLRQSSGIQVNCSRGVINGKAGEAAALPKFLDTLTLSHPGGQIMPTHWLCLV